MNALFVSALPKARSAAEVESFLRSTFPSAADVKVLRDGGSKGGHKGHAYVHFDSSVSLQTAVGPYKGSDETLSTLLWDEASLSMRVVADRKSEPPIENTIPYIAGRPLPPLYIGHAHGDCAIFEDDAGRASVTTSKPEGAPSCDAPLLLQLMSTNSDDVAASCTDDELRRHGLQLLTPAEALQALEGYISGRCGIAVSDRSGATAVLGVPAYAAAYDAV